MDEKPKVKTYKDLLIWQKSMEIVTQVYEISTAFPKDELYGLSSQIRRCAVSIPSNIAEGHSRKSSKDFARFLEISLGSLFEMQTQLEIAVNLKYLDANQFVKINEQSREIERMLTSLIRKIDC